MTTKTKEESTEAEKIWWKDPVKEIALTGLAAVFMTEETVRSKLKDLKLPKELVSLLMENATKKRDEFYSRLAKEFSHWIAKVDIPKELGKFLETHDLKISFEARADKKAKEES